jgi:hypothetical protein
MSPAPGRETGPVGLLVNGEEACPFSIDLQGLSGNCTKVSADRAA